MNLADEYARLCDTPSDIYLHLPRFVELVAELDARRVLELGTRTGVSTVAWLHALDGRGHLTSVDIDTAPPIGNHDHWTFLQGDDLQILPTLDGPFDVVFLDTSHLYDHTCAELELILPLVRPGGRIVCHDTMLRRPEGSPPRPLFPVRKAIEEFTERHDLVWTERRFCWGLAEIEVT